MNNVNTHLDNARVFKAFCDENRLIILEMLRSGEKCACVLHEKLKITQPTLSHHMKILCDSGIVTSRKDKKWTYYSFNKSGVEYALELLDSLTSVIVTSLNEKGCCDERE